MPFSAGHEFSNSIFPSVFGYLDSESIAGQNRTEQAEESNGGGGGIETREEGEIGGEKEGYRSYIVMSLLQSPTCDNVGDSENATGLG